MKNNDKQKLQFNEDFIWMSYRYCIGRHTIAAHYHAETIANSVYGKVTDARMEFFSEDICSCINDQISYKNFIDFGYVPKDKFKPLDIVCSVLSEEKIDSIEKLKSIKSISIDWDNKDEKFKYSLYYFNENDKDRNYCLSLWDFTDLEVWQKLANLLDKRTHKYCKLTDGTISEYYETWKMVNTGDGGFSFRKYKCPVSVLNICRLCYIPMESIKEDNIDIKMNNPKNEKNE